MPGVRIPRPIRRWTAIKLEHLEAYLKAYARATKRWQERYYIDAFAGCGDCILRETGAPIEGSPWRALKVDPPFTACFFIERDPALAAHLRERMADCGNVHILEGDCNSVIPSEVLPKLPRRAPSLAFLDPTGAQLDWETVRALAVHRLGPRKMELLVLYPYDMFIARWLKQRQMAPVLTDMFGGDSWQEALRQSVATHEGPKERRGRFVGLYCDLLRSLNYRFVDPFGPMYSGRRSLYHLVFASDSDVGIKIMHDVWSRPRAIPGELWYRPRP